ncbi:VCBS protein [Grimontia sp. AD028]|uniref:hypothetical protein n=1 Tax=Grimontia sp. AD028 TaxID=1581149 RepID=UPI00061ACC90|nr:hypothetical protein [Grimontia sp. AD028]KKD58740.1 VCBS protein [Grimontia sp. AD028]
MKKHILATFVLATCASSDGFAQCYGNVYAMNAGRGHVGVLLDIQEDKKVTGAYDGSRVVKKSRALFSSSAIAYDSNNNRIYYVSAPRPEAFYVPGLEDETQSGEFPSLDFHASKVKKNQLAYFDPETGTHTIVGETPDVFRMAFDSATNTLFGSNNRDIFSINVDDGTPTKIAEFPIGMRSGGYSSWGDFVFYEGKLLFVTNTRTFVINTTSGEVKLHSFHYVNFVTAATLDQNGQMLIAAKNQNVTGNVNSTWLWRLNPDTGEKVSVGLFPNRISAMATNSRETYKCYEGTVFPSETVIEVADVSGDTVTEGQNADFTINFDKEIKAVKEVTLALRNGTGVAGTDYLRDVTVKFGDDSTTATLTDTGVVVEVPPGVSSISVAVPTTDDQDDEDAKTFFLDAWINEDQSDKASGTATINDNDEPLGACSPGVNLKMRAKTKFATADLWVDCDKGSVVFNATGQVEPGDITLQWTTDYGFNSVTNNHGRVTGHVGLTEVKTLQQITVYGSSGDDRSCSGDIYGSNRFWGWSGTITINDDGTQQCYLRIANNYCDGNGGKVSEVVESYDCDYTD